MVWKKLLLASILFRKEKENNAMDFALRDKEGGHLYKNFM